MPACQSASPLKADLSSLIGPASTLRLHCPRFLPELDPCTVELAGFGTDPAKLLVYRGRNGYIHNRSVNRYFHYWSLGSHSHHLETIQQLITCLTRNSSNTLTSLLCLASSVSLETFLELSLSATYTCFQTPTRHIPSLSSTTATLRRLNEINNNGSKREFLGQGQGARH